MQTTSTHRGSHERGVAATCPVCSRTSRPGIQFCEGCGNNLSPTGAVPDLQELPPPVAPPPMPPPPSAPIATTAATPAAPRRRSWVGRLALVLLVLLPVAAGAGATLLDTPGGGRSTRSQTTAGGAIDGDEEPTAPNTEDEPASYEAGEATDPGTATRGPREPVAEARGHYVPDDLEQWIVDAVRLSEQQWAAVFPATFGFEYEPVDDVIVFDGSVDGTNTAMFTPCHTPTREGDPDDERDDTHAPYFFCPGGNYIAIDREHAGARLESDGTGPLAFTISHEVGHAVQERLGLLQVGVPRLMIELQADCLAGTFVDPEMERVVVNAVTGRRQHGTPTDHPDFDVRTHGSPDEREAAIRHGIETNNCLDYPEGILEYTGGLGYVSPAATGVIGPTPVDPSAVQTTQSLDPLADPTFRTVELGPWFAPDPLAMSLGPASLAGFVDVGPVGTGCRGTTQAAPDVRVEWQGGTSPFLGVTATADATIGLVVLDPRGHWHCAVGSQAAVRIADDPNEHLAASGTYEIWVTRIDPGVDDVTLSVTENDGRGLLDPLREAFQTVALEPGFQPDPFEVATQSGRGHINPKYLGAGCRGSAIDRAHLGIDWEGGPGAFLRIYATSPADLGLVILDPDGQWHCADDSYGPHPSVDFPGGGQPGTYQVWVTNKSDTGTVGASIFVTELEHQHP